MKLIVIMNNETNSIELAIPTRELAAEEVEHLFRMMPAGERRTLHTCECADKIMPYEDIVVSLEKFIEGSENEIEAKSRCHYCNGTGSNCGVFPIEGCAHCDGSGRIEGKLK